MIFKFKNLVKRLSLKSTLVAILFCAASAVGYDAYRDATMTEQERMIQANLEALTIEEESTSVSVCYTNGSGNDRRLAMECNRLTSTSMIYPCARETFINIGVSSMCTK